MTTRVILLNGGSSAGKSTLARALQALLPDPWLSLGVDDLIRAAPPSMEDTPEGLTIASGGIITVGPAYCALETAWAAGVAAIARTGTGVIVDEVLVDGADGQQRWQAALGEVAVLWVAVRCDAMEAARREKLRGDRTVGMAVLQANSVHEGVRYDLAVDTATSTAAECALRIQEALDSAPIASIPQSPPVVPELDVTNLDQALSVYIGVFGFRCVVTRPKERFAYLVRERAHLMLEEAAGPGRRFHTAPLAIPFGRGVNLQIEVSDATKLHAAVLASDLVIHVPLEERWYRQGDAEAGLVQFVVADADGYLLRFATDLGRRPLRHPEARPEASLA